MTDAKTLAVQAIALRVLSDKVRDRTSEVKAELAGHLEVGDRKTAVLPDGSKCGSITYTNGRGGARVVDEQAFTRWVLEQYPDEMVTTVRPSFRDALLGQSKDNGAAVTSDGEVIPGVELYQSDPYLSARPAAGAAAAILSAIRMEQLLAISPPPEYDPQEGE